MSLKETETLELKKSTSELKEAITAISAMLNKHGKGKIYFGIKNDGTVVGQSVSDKTIREISHSIGENIEPKIYPKIKEEKISGKACVIVTFEGTEAPYFAFGRAFMRVGDENRQLSARELGKIFLQKNEDKWRWEIQPSADKLKDINEGLLSQYIEKANLAGRISFSFDNKESILKRLGLIKSGKLLKAAEVLFCNKNSLRVQLAVFAGNDKSTFLDIQMYEGTIFDLIEKSGQYLKEKMNWRVEIPGLQRKEIPEIPIRALRESIINSFCHRDYGAPESNYIAIFKNRIEISNPGKFPEGLEPQDFIKGKHESVLRNPLIAEVLYKSKEIEHWGSGLKKIYDECHADNVKVTFEKRKTSFQVTFYRPVVSISVQDSGKGTDEVTVKVTEKVTENQELILAEMRKNAHVTAGDLSKAVGISERKIKDNIRKLKGKGFIKRIGPDKGGYWEVIR